MAYDKQQYVFMKAFQIAAEESGSLVFIYDLATQTIRVDPKTAKNFGVLEEQPGVPYEMVKLGIIAPDTVDEYIRIHEEILGGAATASGIVRLIQADGSESIQQLNFRSILSADGQPTGSAVGVYRDITDQAKREMEQERYRQAVRSSERYTFRYDIHKDVLSVYAPVNETGQMEQQEDKEYLVMTRDFLKSVDSGAVCPQDQISTARSLFEWGAEQTVYIQMRHVKKGDLVWFAFLARRTQRTGSPPMIYGLLWDATEEVRHRDTYSKLQRVLLGMQDEYIGIFEIDVLKDQFTMLTYHGEDYLPLPQEGKYTALLEKATEQLVTEDYRGEFKRFASLENLRACLARENRIEMEYTIQFHKNRWLRTIFQVTERAGGQPAKVTMYHADIDNQKAERLLQQQALRDAYNYAESANAAKTEFLSRMSHDIRTPMNAIVGMAAIAATHLHEPDRIQDCLTKINMSSRHLLALINDILDMSKIESGAIELQEEEFSLADLIDETLAIVMPAAREHGHSVEVHVQKLRHERVFGDCLRLQQAFVNLLSNAIKYTPDGGNICMTALERPSRSTNYGEYEFSFEDNGIGMSEEFLKVLFEPFTRAEDSRLSKVTGTGLCMAITHNLIRMMDGDIRVDSMPGIGTRFTVTIHLKFVSEDASLPGNLSGLPVLLADDDKDTCESTCILLREIGLDAEWCLSGEQAVALTVDRNRRGEDYFAILLDWKMPGMDGLETAIRIRSKVGDHIPILFLTAYDWSEIESQARSLGITHFLTKPLFKSRLLRSFRELVEPEKQEPRMEAEDCYKNAHVLLVEDNDLNAEIGKELLSMMGITTRRAVNGQEAVDCFLAELPGSFDLIFMDIQMPVMNGYDAAKAIRASGRPDAYTVPIIAMTANAFSEDEKRSLEAGMDEHLTKPVNLDELRRVLRSKLNKR